jgi:hypothetical protein
MQVSKLNSLLLRSCRLAAGASAWDPLVAGSATGKLISLDALDPSALEGLSEPVVVLLRGADGDEEVAAAGAALKGVVLTQELPHLSHLGEWWGVSGVCGGGAGWLALHPPCACCLYGGVTQRVSCECVCGGAGDSKNGSAKREGSGLAGWLCVLLFVAPLLLWPPTPTSCIST